MFSKLISVRSERLFELFKIATFSKAQILDQFKTKFSEVEIPESIVKDFHDLFGIWKDYGPSFLDRFQSVEDLKVFIEKCKSEVNFVQSKLSSFGLPQAAAQNMALQYLQKFVEEINSPDFHSRIEQLKDKKEFLTNLRKALKYGLSEKMALKALTLNPATFLNVQDKIGSLKKDLSANFFISNR